MKRSPRARLLCPALVLALASSSLAQSADPSLVSEINRIRAVDNHAHIPKVVGEGERADEEFDALPCPPEADAVPFARALPDNPEYVAAWRSLYGYAYNDASEAHVRELLEKKRRVMREQGDNYPAWVLDKLGIDITFANRIAMGRGLNNAHFRWVSYDDALLFPLDNAGLKRATPNRQFFFGREEALLRRYMNESRVARLPATRSRSNSRRRICARSTSTMPRWWTRWEFMRASCAAASRRRQSIRRFRIISSAPWRARRDGSALPSTFTRAAAAATSSFSRAAIPRCSNRR
jgi:hypothetical protein